MLATRSESPARNPSDSSRPRLTVLAAGASNRADGIHAYTRRLVATLSDRADVEVSLKDPRGTTFESLVDPAQRLEAHRPMFVLQYNPFNFGRWGFAPWLPVTLWRLKRSSPRPRMALMAHEMYYPITDWRSAIMGGWQRLQFFLVRVMCDVVFTSVGPWADAIRSHWPRRPVHHLPVASNLPDMRHARADARERLALADEAIVLAAFGTDHPSRLLDYVIHAARGVASSGHPTVVLNLGFKALPLNAGPLVRVITPGHLDEEEVARHLAAADIYLAPFSDGVSTRRGTLMAALQHGLAVVGTDGHNTDDTLRDAVTSLRLTPVGNGDAFASAVRELAAQPETRVELGSHARALYEAEFDWPVVSDRLLAELLTPTQSGV
jgi:glycosyltransferase involved in cell wall biosynthesis